jgi:hypothetical protein
MASPITAAARALPSGNALGALNWIALRDDAPALALRGIAMAQLGDLPRAGQLLSRATRASQARARALRDRLLGADRNTVSRALNSLVGNSCSCASQLQAARATVS